MCVSYRAILIAVQRYNIFLTYAKEIANFLRNGDFFIGSRCWVLGSRLSVIAPTANANSQRLISNVRICFTSLPVPWEYRSCPRGG